MRFIPKLPRIKGRTFGVRAVTIGVAGFLVAGALGGGALGWLLQPNPITTSQYTSMSQQLNHRLSSARSDLSSARNEAAKADARAQVIVDREAALKDGEGKLKADQATLAADQAALAAETQQVQSTQFGDGVHLVGTNVTPGVYAANGVDCYYAWMSGTGADAQIVDNNLLSGPVTATLVAGQTFETNRCGTWTKIG